VPGLHYIKVGAKQNGISPTATFEQREDVTDLVCPRFVEVKQLELAHYSLGNRFFVAGNAWYAHKVTRKSNCILKTQVAIHEVLDSVLFLANQPKSLLELLDLSSAHSQYVLIRGGEPAKAPAGR